MDVRNSFMQTVIPEKLNGKRVIMKILRKLVQWLLELDPTFYKGFVLIEKGAQVLYLDVLRASCGMLEASMLWYNQFRGDLESEGFVFNE